jgi:hypothetical protein
MLITETLASKLQNVRLTRDQRNQSFVAAVSNGDNSLSMLWVKLGALYSMIHNAGGDNG